MSSDPSIPSRSPQPPVLTRRDWQALPVVRTNHAALAGGLRPGEYRRRGDTFERYLAALGAVGEPPDGALFVEEVDGITLRLQIERASTRSPDAVTPAALRGAVDRLIRAALAGAAGAGAGPECGHCGHR
jgi:hypothetical protein